MADRYPSIDEYGAGACYTPGGMAIGCAVCSLGNVLLRLGKPIPRLSGGTPDMRTLGARIGARCRSVYGTSHGLALSTNNHEGRKWGTCCVYLGLRDRGIAARHGVYSKSQVIGFLRLRKPLVVPGIYGRIPRVSATSYSSTVPAKGRSDSYTGGHMMNLWGIASNWADGSPRQIIASDSDFGSASRPRVPPHSVLAASAVWSFIAGWGWRIVVVDQKLPALTAPAPTGTLRVRVTCDTIARRAASISSDKLGGLPKGSVLTVTATSEGGHWSGCGEEGTKWRKFTHVNGVSTMKKWGRAYAYAAAGLTDPF